MNTECWLMVQAASSHILLLSTERGQTKGTSRQSSETQPGEMSHKNATICMYTNYLGVLGIHTSCNNMRSCYCDLWEKMFGKSSSRDGNAVLTTTSFPAFSSLLATFVAAAAAAPDEIPTCTMSTQLQMTQDSQFHFNNDDELAWRSNEISKCDIHGI